MSDPPTTVKGRKKVPPAQPSTVLADLGERVALMEATRDNGLQLANKISIALAKSPSCHNDADVQNWEKTARGLFLNVRKRALLVGICGETGLGKSSLINALLDTDIAPTSEAEACTAAVCIFSWNEDDDPEKAFRANIRYKNIESVEQDLSPFIEELRELRDIKPEDCDSEVKARRDDAKRNLKLIQAWSGLTESAIKTATSAKWVIRNSNHKALKGDSPEAHHTESIVAGSAREFSRALAPFIDSKNRKKTDWPLVELVQVYVKASVLQHGIKIVDLPGVMDALESRAAIAKSYMWRLDKRIIVVPAARATDSKTAVELMLPSPDIIDLQLDDQFGRDSLAVAVNGIDNIGVESAEEEWGEDNEPLRDVCVAREAKVIEVADLDDELKELRSEMDDLRTADQASDSDNDNPNSGSSTPRKRRHEACDSSQLKGLEDKLSHLKQRRMVIEGECTELEHTLKRLCIMARNNRIVGNFAENFRDDAKPDAQPIRVFPNSSHAYAKLKNGRSFPGFVDLESTGVDALRRWIIQVSLPRREEAAKSQIQCLHTLFDAADGWTKDVQHNSLAVHLSRSEATAIFNCLSAKFKLLTTVITKEVQTASSKIGKLQPLRDSHISKRSKASSTDNAGIASAVQNFERAFKLWTVVNCGLSDKTKKMHWLTYRKCIRMKGLQWTSKSKTGGTYNWMDTIYQSFWRTCLSRWRIEMHQKLSNIESQLVSTVRKKFDNFLVDLMGDADIRPEFLEMLKPALFVLNNELEAFVEHIYARFNQFRQTARAHRLDTQKTFARHMQKGFEDAIAEKGRNSFKRQQELLENHTNVVKFVLFKEARDHMEKELQREKNSMTTDIKKHWEIRRKAGIMNHLARFIQSLCPGFRTKSVEGTRSTAAVTERDTKKFVQQAVIKWRKEWEAVEPKLPRPEIGMTFDDAQKIEQEKLEKAQRKKEGKKSTKKAFRDKAVNGLVFKEEDHESDTETEIDDVEPETMVIKQEGDMPEF